MRSFAALLALSGCGSDPTVFADPRTIELAFPSAPNKKLDLLFQIDDSPGGAELQAQLSTAVDVLLAGLRVDGALPDLHIGVITSDMGTTGSDDPSRPGPPVGQIGNGGCAGAGDDGRLQTFGAPVTDAYLVDESDGAGGRRTNYSGELPVILGRMFRGAGAGGCGFEQPFHATRRALAASQSGFLRADAHLGVVFLADEDDCSLKNPTLLGPESAELGPLQSYRCMQFGVTCDQPLDEIGDKTNCRAREDSPYVEGIELTRSALVASKANPSLLTVAAIVGVPTPFLIELRAPPGGGTGQLSVAHSCSFMLSTGINVADPAVRTVDLVQSFAGRGVVTSVCNADYAPALREITRVLKHSLGVVCLDSSRLTDSNTERGIQPACELSEISGDTETPITDFTIEPDALACPETADHLRLVVKRSDTPPAGAWICARCETPF